MLVHVILNSHLDPVWAWRRAQGMDEVIGTARTACDLLDEFPEIYTVRGEVWFYETVEAVDPELFKRIAAHVDSGRWSVVGGLYVQPDCNFTGLETFRRQARYARKYFHERFGITVGTAWHVDSFGHTATLPDVLAECGFRNYAMMRPERAVLPLPGNTFHWKGLHGGTVTTFRIAEPYCTTGPDLEANILRNLNASLDEADSSLNETMCLIGIGNHGGGPARREIEFLKKNRNYRSDVRLEFSTPDRYFDSVSKKTIPEYQGELQYHAIGCYSAVSRIKKEVCETESLLLASERCAAKNGINATPLEQLALEDGWKSLFFASFHDILPGTAVESALADIYDDLGGARSIARRRIERMIRLRNSGFAADSQQRLIFDNFSEREFHDWFEFEPWLGYVWAIPELDALRWGVTDENGNRIPLQRIRAEAAMGMSRYLLKLKVPAGGRAIYKIFPDNVPETFPPVIPTAKTDSLGIADFHGISLRIAVCDDSSDTWSHGIGSYGTGESYRLFSEKPWKTLESGNCMTECGAHFSGEDVHLAWKIREYRDSDFMDFELRWNWTGERRMMRLVLNPGFAVEKHLDSIPGGMLERPADGREYPVLGGVELSDSAGRTVSVAGDSFTSLSVGVDGMLRIMLQRSPVYTHHNPFVLPEDHFYPVTDRGEHRARFRIRCTGTPLAEADFERMTDALSPMIFPSEATKGVHHE